MNIEQKIESLKTENGGWTRASLESLGVSWPPPKGWKQALIKEHTKHEDQVGYLHRKKVTDKTRAHIWLGKDTACRMYSTGGIKRKWNYTVSKDVYNMPICENCKEKGNAM